MSQNAFNLSRRAFVQGFGSAAALSLLTLSGCGGSSDVSSSAGSSSASAGMLEQVTLGSSSAISTLSVNQEAGSANYQIAALFQEGLTGLDAEGNTIPALATEWKTEDNLTWVFDLRENVKLHNGETLTADDIVFSINTARDAALSPGLSTYWPDYVESAEKTGDNQVTITLSSESADFDTQVSNASGLFVTSEAFWDEAGSDYGSSKSLIVGTGPYKVTEFDSSSHVTLERFEDWWGDTEGPQTVRIDFIPEDSTRLLAFQDGSIDVSLNVPVTNVDEWEQNGTISTYSDRSYYGLTFDPTVAPFDDEHVRRAVAYALDKESIVSGILKGYGTVATGIDAPEQLAGWAGSVEKAEKLVADLGALEFDLEKAKAELAKSSQAGGFSTTLTYPTGYAAVGQASLALAQSLEEIGIELEVNEITLDQWLSEVGNGEQGVAWMIYNPTTSTPNEITSWLLAAGGVGANPANWTDDDVAEKTDSIYALTDDEERLDIVLETTKVALEQAIYAPAWWGQALVATKEGVTFKNSGSYWLATPWADEFVGA